MKAKVLGISTSPRPDGNSDSLLRQALAGAESAKASVEYVSLRDLKIGPCIECNSCYTTGMCRIEDDYQGLLQMMLDADRLIFAAPIFFMNVCAQAKTLIDRGQCLWAQKYVLKKQLFPGERDRRAMVIAVGGSKSTKMFDCVTLTMKTYFDSLQMHYVCNLFVNKVDEPGRIENHPFAMTEAFRLGSELTAADAPPPEQPLDVRLT